MRALLLPAAALVMGAATPLATAAAENVSPQAVVCKPIRNAAELQAIENDLAGSYCLMNDIDAGSVANFVPIGAGGTPFSGSFFGNGHVIRNLTIRSDAEYVGLFGDLYRALIQDVGLVNADIAGSDHGAYVGGLAGEAYGYGTPTEIRRVHVTGRVAATGASAQVGGIVGVAYYTTLADSWSSAAVNGTTYTAGGAVGSADFTTISRVYATGPVTCQSYYAGGLVGAASEAGTVALSHASGPVVCADNSHVGGLIGYARAFTIERSHALGAVTTGAVVGGGNYATAGGLIGYLDGGSVSQVYAVGRVTGGTSATVGGLVATTINAPTVTDAYWDVNTSVQTASAAGVGQTTGVLRTALPSGFGAAWAITRKRSYPLLNQADIAFAAPLATLVKNRRVYTFLPIDQHDTGQYADAPAGANAASLAAAYTMIARAIGITRSIAKLKDVTIDKYFWNDAAKTTAWQGPVTTRATLGTFAPIAANAALNDANVIGAMKSGKLVLLRGSYTKGNGNSATHWMLGTLFTTEPGGGALAFVIANDPWTGEQVMIDPASKKVVWPDDHPLTNFRINGYQPVMLN